MIELAKPIEITTTAPIELERTSPGALPPVLQSIATGYIDARKRAGYAWLDMGRFLAEARQAAKHGEWGVFLQATNTSEDQAKRLMAIYTQSLHDRAFADAVRTNVLNVSTAYELTSAPPDVQQRILSSETPPTQRQIRDEKREAAKSAAPPTLETRAQSTTPAAPTEYIPHLPPDFTDAQKRAAVINLHIVMDMNGMFSIKNERGSGVDHIAEWDSLLRHLAYSEQTAAEIARERAARPASAPSEPEQASSAAKSRMTELLNRLAPLIKHIKTEDFEGLSQAISDLNECQEGTEAENWLRVGYALCDVEP